MIFRPSLSTFRFEYEYFLRLKVSSTSTQKSCTRVYSSTSTVLEYSTDNWSAVLIVCSVVAKVMRFSPFILYFRSEVTNMRPAKEFSVAREHFGETSTFTHFFPV